MLDGGGRALSLGLKHTQGGGSVGVPPLVFNLILVVLLFPLKAQKPLDPRVFRALKALTCQPPAQRTLILLLCEHPLLIDDYPSRSLAFMLLGLSSLLYPCYYPRYLRRTPRTLPYF
jgi:hypothetical protein